MLPALDRIAMKSLTAGLNLCTSHDDLYHFIRGAIPRLIDPDDSTMTLIQRTMAIALLHSYLSWRIENPTNTALEEIKQGIQAEIDKVVACATISHAVDESQHEVSH